MKKPFGPSQIEAITVVNTVISDVNEAIIPSV